MRVLVVDDDEDIRVSLRRALALANVDGVACVRDCVDPLDLPAASSAIMSCGGGGGRASMGEPPVPS